MENLAEAWWKSQIQTKCSMRPLTAVIALFLSTPDWERVVPGKRSGALGASWAPINEVYKYM